MDATSSTTCLNSLPLSVAKVAGGPKVLMIVLRKNAATVSAFLSASGCNKTNLEKGSTATKRCFIFVLLGGKSTNRSKDQVHRGPGGNGNIALHLG